MQRLAGHFHLPGCAGHLLEMSIPANDRIDNVPALDTAFGGTIEPTFAGEEIRTEILNHQSAAAGAI